MSGAVASTSSSPAITVSSLTATTTEASTSNPTDVVTLTLVPRRRRARKEGVRWAEDVVDNEGLGKKSSKKCCIFHKRRVFGEWSDDEDSDAECDCQ